MRPGIILFLILAAVVGAYLSAIYLQVELVAGSDEVATMAIPAWCCYWGIPVIGDIIGGFMFGVDTLMSFYALAQFQFGFLDGSFAIVRTGLVAILGTIVIYLAFSIIGRLRGA